MEEDLERVGKSLDIREHPHFRISILALFFSQCSEMQASREALSELTLCRHRRFSAISCNSGMLHRGILLVRLLPALPLYY